MCPFCPQALVEVSYLKVLLITVKIYQHHWESLIRWGLAYLAKRLTHALNWPPIKKPREAFHPE